MPRVPAGIATLFLASRDLSVDTLQGAGTMKKEIRLSNSELLAGVRVRFCGYHDCPGGYSYGPVARDEFIIHFVREGTGRYQINRYLFHIRAGCSFTLFPGVLLHYQADKADPWRYYWIAFDGKDVGTLLQRIEVTPSRPVVFHRKPATVLRLFEQMLSAISAGSLRGDLAVMGCFHRLLAVIAADATTTGDRADRHARVPLDEHVLKAISLIQENYHDSRLTVEQVAALVCLERSYFSKLFKSYTGATPHRFLNRTRLESACRLLEDFSLPVKEVAATVGFRDQNYFDKVFRSGTGVCPSEYREALQERAGRKQGPKDQEFARNLFS
jgi:AraC-like DNA-binding protein